MNMMDKLKIRFMVIVLKYILGADHVHPDVRHDAAQLINTLQPPIPRDG